MGNSEKTEEGKKDGKTTNQRSAVDDGKREMRTFLLSSLCARPFTSPYSRTKIKEASADMYPAQNFEQLVQSTGDALGKKATVLALFLAGCKKSLTQLARAHCMTVPFESISAL